MARPGPVRPLPDPPLALVTGEAADVDDLVERCLRAIDGGIAWIQIRSMRRGGSRLEGGAMYEAAMRLRDRSSATIVINDRLDVARLAGAGLHLPAAGFTPWRARDLLGPQALLGRSVHSLGEVEAAPPGVDYVQLGPVFDTPSKRPFGPPLGPALVRDAAAHLRRQPSPPALVAIGGIDGERLAQVAEAGADAAAVIGAIWNATDVHTAAAELVRKARSCWQRTDAQSVELM